MFYAVAKGRKVGIYGSWEECRRQVHGFSGATYRKFKDLDEAENYLKESGTGGIPQCILTSTNTEPLLEEGMIKDVDTLEEDEAIAYVDGSYSDERKDYGYGVVYIDSSGQESMFNGRGDHPDLVKMRNVAGELVGASVAMRKAVEEGVKRLYLHYDYAGIENWALGSWRTRNEGAQLYKEFVDNIKPYLEVVFIKVKAHSGIKYNEVADSLASLV